MRHFKFTLLTLLTLSLAADTLAQLNVNGSLELVVKKYREEPDYTNLTFSGQNAFRSLRSRLFFDAAISEKTSAFVQIFTDSYKFFSIYGAYIKVTDLAGPYLNLQAGRIPSPVGSFGPRTYADKNPLIGTPLVWNHHSSLTPGRLGYEPTVSDLLGMRDNRTNYGLPILYDFCWNGGVEFFGSVGQLDYSLGLLAGSVGYPLFEQTEKLPQVTTHLQYYFSPGMVFGVSTFYGPYLYEYFAEGPAPEGFDPAEYMNGGAGYEFYFAHKLIEIYSEAYYSFWEYPQLPELHAVSGYVEAKYKFIPGWYAAGRVDIFQPNKIGDEEGGRQRWDYPVTRYEVGIGFKPERSVILKAVTQINQFDGNDELNMEHYALQMCVVFH